MLMMMSLLMISYGRESVSVIFIHGQRPTSISKNEKWRAVGVGRDWSGTHPNAFESRFTHTYNESSWRPGHI